MSIKIQINKKILEADSLAVLAYSVEKEVNKILEIKESSYLATLSIKSILQGLQVYSNYHKNISVDDYEYYANKGIFNFIVSEELDNLGLDFPAVSRSIDLWLQGTNESKFIVSFRNADNQLVIDDENLDKLDKYFD
jgi:hypothetical protein